MTQLREYQQAAIDAVRAYWREGGENPLVEMATGCHAAGTGILMFDGTIKAVENVQSGDLLMGPDSQPRRVLNLARGREPMYRITPNKGEPFVVNENHILCLKTTNEGKNYAASIKGGQIDCIKVKDYLTKNKTWKHLRKLWRTGVDFSPREHVMPPWIVGVFLGDGCLSGQPSVCSPDQEVLNGICDFAEEWRLNWRVVQKPDNKAWDVFFRDESEARFNRLTDEFRKVGLWGLGSEEKYVPDCYKLSCLKDRLEILAGLLDTDGHFDGKNNFDFISKSRRLSDDVVYLARSVGLYAKSVPSEKFCQTGGGGTYWRVCISGDVAMIPTRVARKRGNVRLQKKNPLVTGFRVEPIGEGEFFGFALDGDHLYLASDFIVHHNTGKSLTMAGLLKGLLGDFSGLRVIVLVHVRELVAQDATAMLKAWPGAPIGINSAGLGRRDRHSQILFASIQSVYRDDAFSLGPRDLVLIDECHLVPFDGEGMYRNFLEKLRHRTPDLRVVGFTATPFRTGSGRLDQGEGRLFSRIVYEYGIGKAILDGFLSTLISKATATTIDVSKVHVRGGEFVARELEVAVDQDFVTRAAIAEIVEFGANRRSWIAFCTGVEHAGHVRDEMRRHGVACEMVSGQTPKGERDRILRAFKAGHIRCLTNCSVLTTGFDAPNVDLIALLRPTLSPGLYVQMIGRGTRLAEGKSDCLVLDFAGNVKRHGPVDTINARSATSRSGGDKDAVRAKECPECATLLHLGALECPTCGHSFRREDETPLPKHDVRADAEHSILSTGAPAWVPVQSINAYPHEKMNSPTSMRVEYFCGLTTQREWVCFEHPGFARSKAVAWWQKMGGLQPTPTKVSEAIARLGELARVEAIQVRPNGRFFDIVGRRLGRRAA